MLTTPSLLTPHVNSKRIDFSAPATGHASVVKFVADTVLQCQPETIHWCDGSEDEYHMLVHQAIDAGILTPLDQSRHPGCYYHRSNPNDVARVEDRTFICTTTKDEAGPTNNWMEPHMMYDRLRSLTSGAMRKRTMYVIPYMMGPPGSSLAKVGIEITDSLYVVLSMRTMTRMGDIAWRELGETGTFSRGLHCMLTINPAERWIAHFPQDNTIISTNSNYGGNVLLGKKCLALRLGSWLGHQEGWLAEHMLILGVESPTGEKTYVAAAFPSACGKTNFAMLIPPAAFEGWKIWTVGDDIAWMRPGVDGKLYAINPENGYFGVAPGTNRLTNPIAMETVAKNTIFTNVALTNDGGVWWEGMDDTAPLTCQDWKGEPWTPQSASKAAHPNSRFCAPMTNNPNLALEANDPNGVPISAIIFGGRRATTFPVIMQAFNWAHGVYLGATMGSETTAAAVGAIGQVRRDPMAMLPFCGYNMGDYFSHWIHIGKKLSHPPRIFHVNWFRKDDQGHFQWPGFCDNMRVFKWIIDRCHGRSVGKETPLGWMPEPGGINLSGINNYGDAQFADAQRIDYNEWRNELELQNSLFDQLADRMPKELIYERELLRSRLGL